MAPLVLITGGAGFIGFHLTSLFISQGYLVRILDNLIPQVHGSLPSALDWLIHPSIDYRRGSVTVKSDIERALVGVDYVVHLAAETGTGQSMYEISRYNSKILILGCSYSQSFVGI